MRVMGEPVILNYILAQRNLYLYDFFNFRSGYMLKDTVNFAEHIEKMMRQTLGVSEDETVEDEEDLPEEDPVDDQDDEDEEIDDEEEEEVGDEAHDEL